METITYKALFVHGNSNIIAGQELSLIARIEALKQAGVECNVLLPERGIFSDLLNDKNISVRFIKLNRFSKKNPLPYFRTVLGIFRLIKKEGISIVHTSGAYPTQYCLPAARLAKIPCITHVNQTLYSRWDFKSSFVKFVDAVVCISEAVKKVVISSIRIQEQKVFVSYNGITNDIVLIDNERKEQIRKLLNIENNTKIVGQVGQIIPRKGLEYFIKMARIVKDNYPKVKFMVVGAAAPGYEEYENSLKKLTKDLDLDRDILFTGFKQPKEAYELLNLFDVSVLASLEEGLGRVIFESSALGKPVVGSDISSISEAILHNQTGFIVPVKNPEALADAVLFLLKNTSKSQEFGENGRRFVFERFNMDNHRVFLLKLYNSLLNKKLLRSNILFYEPSSGFGGSASALVNVIEHLDSEKFNPVIAIKNYGPQFEKIMKTEPIKLKNCKGPFSVISEVIKLIQLIINKKISLVHINTNITTGIPAILASKLCNIPCVCHIRETRKFIKRERFFARWVDRFIILNHDAYKICKQNFPNSEISIIYDGLNLDDFTKTTGGVLKKEYNLDSMPVIGTIGRIVEGKGQKEFILAAREVLRLNSNTKFVIVGDAKAGDNEYYRNIRKSVLDSGLNESIIFTGWRDDVKNVLSDLDIFVFTSTTYPEGLPNVILEAMALCKPVIATNIPGPSDIVVNKETGFLVPSGDIKAMAEKIIYFLDNPDIAKKMGEEGRKRAEELFDIKKQIKEIEAIYEELLVKK